MYSIYPGLRLCHIRRDELHNQPSREPNQSEQLAGWQERNQVHNAIERLRLKRCHVPVLYDYLSSKTVFDVVSAHGIRTSRGLYLHE
jgi:hypothetical protein